MITLEPIGVVRSRRADVEDDDWGRVEAQIVIDSALPIDALDGIDGFSHAEVIFHFDRVPVAAVVSGARHPRGNHAWPKVGILAQRAKARPNRLGSTIVEVIGPRRPDSARARAGRHRRHTGSRRQTGHPRVPAA